MGWMTMLSAFLYNYIFVVLELVKAISEAPVIKCISLVWGVRLIPVWGGGGGGGVPSPVFPTDLPFVNTVVPLPAQGCTA